MTLLNSFRKNYCYRRASSGFFHSNSCIKFIYAKERTIPYTIANVTHNGNPYAHLSLCSCNLIWNMLVQPFSIRCSCSCSCDSFTILSFDYYILLKSNYRSVCMHLDDIKMSKEFHSVILYILEIKYTNRNGRCGKFY